MHISLLKWQEHTVFFHEFSHALKEKRGCLFFFFCLFFLLLFFFFSSLTLERILSGVTPSPGFWDTDLEQWWRWGRVGSSRDRGKWEKNTQINPAQTSGRVRGLCVKDTSAAVVQGILGQERGFWAALRCALMCGLWNQCPSMILTFPLNYFELLFNGFQYRDWTT